MASSADLAKQATITWDEWCHRVRTGRYSDADLKKTKWWQAGNALQRETRTPPPPTPGPGHPPGNRCVYFSAVNQGAIDHMARLGHGYTALFSADLNLSRPGGSYYVTEAQLAQLANAGVTTASWCDCSATPYAAAKNMAEDRSLFYAGGQAENPDQYLQATRGGANHIIGEPSNLKADPDVLKDAIRRSYDGTLAFIGEVMRPDPGYSAQGINITSACLYVDRDAAQGGYIPLISYSVMPAPLLKGASIYTGGRMSDDDWNVYADWTRL